MRLILWRGKPLDSPALERLGARSVDLAGLDGPMTFSNASCRAMLCGPGRVVSVTTANGIRRNQGERLRARTLVRRFLAWLGEGFLDGLAGSGLGLIAGSSLGFVVCGISMARNNGLNLALAILMALTISGTIIGSIFGVMVGRSGKPTRKSGNDNAFHAAGSSDSPISATTDPT